MDKTGKRQTAGLGQFRPAWQSHLESGVLQGKERKKWMKLFLKSGASKKFVSDLAAYLSGEDEFWSEPWRDHWRRKQELRRRLRRSYMLLIFFTVLFGMLVFGLHWVTQMGAQGSVGPVWHSTKGRKNLKMDDNYRDRIMAVVENPRPKAKDLQVLRGAVLSDTVLRHWGEVHQLTNGSGDADLLYFTGARVYLLRSGQRILYAGRKKP